MSNSTARSNIFRAEPRIALPVVTFTRDLNLYLNGDDIRAFHAPNAHTDGDTVVQFAKSDVIHMGDTFITGRYPFVDLSSGGNVNGFVTAADRALTICNSETKIIPGHGTLSDCEGLRGWRDMIATVRERVRVAMRDGKSLDAIKAARSQESGPRSQDAEARGQKSEVGDQRSVAVAAVKSGSDADGRSKLRERLESLRVQLSHLLGSHTEEHPEIVTLKSQISSLALLADKRVV